MIIKKSQFKYSRETRGNWPFTVDEVAVMALDFGVGFELAIVHQYNVYALSGSLEKQNFKPLVLSGIWAKNPEAPRHHKNLTAFFKFCERQIETIVERAKMAAAQEEK